MSYKDWNTETLLDFLIVRANVLEKPLENTAIQDMRAEILRRANAHKAPNWVDLCPHGIWVKDCQKCRGK
jgi:ethanolamine utilization cobalamin adenosyltransferase